MKKYFLVVVCALLSLSAIADPSIPNSCSVSDNEEIVFVGDSEKFDELLELDSLPKEILEDICKPILKNSNNHLIKTPK